jgi:pimeloyl-ACP methyl ester carboxylesterase
LSWVELQRGGTRLACRDFGADGQPVVCLHGLAGHSGEWAETAVGLGAGYRVFAMDQRGHGRSERRPADVSRDAFVADVAHVITELELAPVVLIGQSMGGNTAFLAAAANPELIAALVVVEASPDGPAPELAAQVQRWLAGWPVPFRSSAHAAEFFRSQGLAPAAWVAGLEQREGCLWPAFDSTVMVDCVADLAARDYWGQWRQIRCPTLIVCGEHGNFSPDHVQRLADALPEAQTATIFDGGHDAHLDNPGDWVNVLEQFLHAAPKSG